MLKELCVLYDLDVLLAYCFLCESCVVGVLNHMNIVIVFDYFEYVGMLYIVMEYLLVGLLRLYVGTMLVLQIGVVLEGLLAGLMSAEVVGVVYRDFKLENVMVSGEGKVKIVDFGIVKATSGLTGVSMKMAIGLIVGTLGYMLLE